MYTAVAKTEDGQRLEVTGDIIQCANWADNIIRACAGPVTIEIVKVEE